MLPLLDNVAQNQSECLCTSVSAVIATAERLRQQHLSDRLCELRLRPTSCPSSTWSVSMAAGPAASAAASSTAAGCTTRRAGHQQHSTDCPARNESGQSLRPGMSTLLREHSG